MVALIRGSTVLVRQWYTGRDIRNIVRCWVLPRVQTTTNHFFIPTSLRNVRILLWEWKLHFSTFIPYSSSSRASPRLEHSRFHELPPSFSVLGKSPCWVESVVYLLVEYNFWKLAIILSIDPSIFSMWKVLHIHPVSEKSHLFIFVIISISSIVVSFWQKRTAGNLNKHVRT